MHYSIGVSPADLKVKKQDDDLLWCDAKSRKTGRIRFIREIRVESVAVWFEYARSRSSDRFARIRMTECYFFSSQLNIQLTPNLSVNMPNFAPQN